MQYYYVAFVPTSSGLYSIFSPDFPEIASQGGNLGECADMGKIALRVAAQNYAKAGKNLPAPCSLEEGRQKITAKLKEINVTPAGSVLLQMLPIQ